VDAASTAALESGATQMRNLRISSKSPACRTIELFCSPVCERVQVDSLKLWRRLADSGYDLYGRYNSPDSSVEEDDRE
jgi:hypothetical protein